MAHLLLIATSICPVLYILQSGLNLTWNPPNIKRRRQTLVTPFCRKRNKGSEGFTGSRSNGKKVTWLGGSVGWSVVPYTKRLWVQFPVRAHTQVAGLIPSWGTYGRQPMDVSLSFLSSLSQINKHILG